MRTVLAVLALLQLACGSRACSVEDERRLLREVEVLVSDLGPATKEAKQRLVRRGRRAIPVLETGMYEASAAGRARIIDTLVAIGDPEVLPILEFRAQRDPDELVRRRALSGLEKLRSSSPK